MFDEYICHIIKEIAFYSLDKNFGGNWKIFVNLWHLKIFSNNEIKKKTENKKFIWTITAHSLNKKIFTKKLTE